MYSDSEKEIVNLIVLETFGMLDEPRRKTLREWIAKSDANRMVYERLRSGESTRYFLNNFAQLRGEEIIAAAKEKIRLQMRCGQEEQPWREHESHFPELREQRMDIERERGRMQDERLERDKRRQRDKQRRQRDRWRRLMLRTGLSAAACLLVAAVASVLLMQDPHTEPVAIDSAADAPQHEAGVSSETVMLATSDGKRIALSDDEQGSKWREKLAEHGAVAQAHTPVKAVTISVTVPRGSTFRLELDDGTKVWLNEESKFDYPERFDGEREVTLSGEAYFEVAKDGGNVFVVEMDEGRVDVLGTKFNVRGYADTPEIKIALIEGSVRVARGDESVILAPDHQAVIVRDGAGIGVDAAQNAAESMEWIYGRFGFENASLSHIIESLAEWYGLKTDYDVRAVETMLGVSFHSVRYDDCSRVLASLAAVTGLDIGIDANAIVVRTQ